MTVPPTLLCVHPHPDDESIGCGGLLAQAADRGVRTVVVTCTGGEEGENLAGIDLGSDDLATHRQRELAAALEILGVATHHQLGYRDSGMDGSPSNDHPDSFHQAELDAAAGRLAQVIRQERPHVLVSDGRDGTYGHPDHVKAHAVVARAIALAGDARADMHGRPWPVSKWYVHAVSHARLRDFHDRMLASGLSSPFGDGPFGDEIPFGVPDDDITVELDVFACLDRKRGAMAAHRSQIGPDSFFLNTAVADAPAAFGIEQFVRLMPPSTSGEREDDLFAGVMPSAPEPALFRQVMGTFATGVTVLTSATNGVPHGMTVNALTSVSLDPPLILVCLDRATTMTPVIEAAGAFAVNILGTDQQARSAWFADSDRPSGDAQFSGVPLVTDRNGVPRFADAVGWIDCVVHAVHDGGDHLIVVGRVVGLSAGAQRDPLVFARGTYGRYVPLD